MFVVMADDGETDPSSAPGGSSGLRVGLRGLEFKVPHVPRLMVRKTWMYILELLK